MTIPTAPGANKAQGEYGPPALPLPVLALISKRESWRQRAEAKERRKESASYERRMHIVATANLIRAERKWERQQRKAG
jgi:hypothetical protein